MQQRLSKILGGIAIVVVIFAVTFGGYRAGYGAGFGEGKKHSDTVVVTGVANATSSKAGDADFGTFWQAWQLVNDSYLNNASVSNEKKVQGAIRGLVSSLGDPYTQYFDPEENKQFLEDVEGNFSGIGAEIGIRKDQLVIVAPLKGSPAERSGLKAGDKVLGINTSSTDGISIDEAVRQIRGPLGTSVKLTIFRDGWDKTKEFSINRENIEVPTLTYEMKGSVAYIQLSSFNSNAPQLFADAVNEALAAGAKGMILDLRNDPGGYLQVAVELAGWFVPKGDLVVSKESRFDPKREELTSEGTAILKDMPIAILINGGSASASEILAGSLRDNLKVDLVGEKSFGKGTVQQILPLKDDASVKITVAHWVLPSGQILDHDGLNPTVEVKLTEEDAAAGKDPQLDKALEVVKSKIK